MAASDAADEQLASYLATTDDDAAERRLGDLIQQHAMPLVRRTVSHRLGGVPGDVEDVCSQVLLQLVVRLRNERMAGGSAGTIDAFSRYVATAAHHGCDHFVRAKYPLRWLLRNRIRRVLEHDVRFATWKYADTWICGVREWRDRPSSPPRVQAPELSDVPSDDIPGLLTRLFESSGPLELTTVVDLAAAVWGVPLMQRDDGAELELVADREPRVDQVLDQRARLDAVWTQIRELPLRQRHAVLLNLRDDAITLFMTSGVVTLRGIADVLELAVEEFAALWNDLPLPDNAIAARLGCTRQQVINLRLAARKRLANRVLAQANIGGGPFL